MALEIHVEVDDQRLRQDVARWIDRGADLSGAFRQIDADLNVFFEKQFMSSGAHGGAPWAPLAASTRKRRVRPGGNRGGLDRPLWDTARTKESLDNSNSPEAIRVIEPHRYQRGTTVPWVIFHQKGTTRIPQREVIPEPLPPWLVDQWLDTIGEHVLGGEGR